MADEGLSRFAQMAIDGVQQLRERAELWKQRCEVLREQLEQLVEAPCPHCGKKP